LLYPRFHSLSARIILLRLLVTLSEIVHPVCLVVLFGWIHQVVLELRLPSCGQASSKPKHNPLTKHIAHKEPILICPQCLLAKHPSKWLSKPLERGLNLRPK